MAPISMAVVHFNKSLNFVYLSRAARVLIRDLACKLDNVSLMRMACIHKSVTDHILARFKLNNLEMPGP